MRDEWRQAGLLPSLLRTGRLDRRMLLRTAGGVGVAGLFGVTARRPGAAAQDAGGAIIRSRSRAAVMEEILDAYPLRREGAPEGGSIIVANLDDFESFNPYIASSVGAFNLLSLVFEGLVGVHPVNGSIVPGLADYEVAADGVTYTFHIHPDARFHDGAPVTAADAEFTLDLIFDPANMVDYASSVQAVLKEYRAVDDRTFVMVSNGPIASFLYDVPTVVMPKHIWEGIPVAEWAADPGSTGQDPARVVGSGPFRFVEWVQGDRATLARNDDYWNRELSRAPYLDNLIFAVMPDNDSIVRALEAGDVDVAWGGAANFDRLAGGNGLAVVSYDDLGFTYYAYQLDRDKTPLFQEPAVRQALFVALDRPAMVDTIFAGHGEIARGAHHPSSPAYAPDEVEPYDYDPDRARDLLAQAGWVDANGDGVVEKEGQRFSFTMLIRGGSSGYELSATYMQDAWAQVGVEVTVEPMPFPTLLDRVFAGDFEMVLLGQSFTADPGQGGMFATGGNFFGYSNAEYDRLEEEQKRTLDREQRIALIKQQAKIVWDELPVGILAFGAKGVGHTERLHNIFPNAFGGLMWSAPFWYLEG